MSIKLKAALVRALRTYLVVAGPALMAVASSANPFDIAAWKIAALSGVPAVLTFLWRYFLDPSPVPSLKDADQAS